MPPYPAIPAAQWNVLDTELLSLLQLATLEPDDAGVTWASGMWTQAQVVSWINDIVRDFLAQTGLTAAIDFLTGVPAQGSYDLPQNLIDLRRIAWRPGGSGTGYEELTLVDTFNLDENNDDWPANQQQVPTGYLLNLLPSLTVRVHPTPNDIGEAEITLSTLGTEATGAGALLPIPDDWVPYIMWGILGEMLSKQGEASDPERAAYCQQRYQEGVELARIMCGAVA